MSFNDYEIIINYKEDFLAKIKEKIKLMLTTLSGDNVAKSNLFDKIYYQCFSLEEIINAINVASASNCGINGMVGINRC